MFQGSPTAIEPSWNSWLHVCSLEVGLVYVILQNILLPRTHLETYYLTSSLISPNIPQAVESSLPF